MHEYTPSSAWHGVRWNSVHDKRCRFLLEALHELQQQLVARGSGLYFALARLRNALAAVMGALRPSAARYDLHYYVGIGRRALAEEQAVSDAFHAIGDGLDIPCALHCHWGHTLFHPEDALSALAKMSRKGSKSRAAAGDSPAASLPERFNAQPAAFAAIPHVMTDFRKANSVSHRA